MDKSYESQSTVSANMVSFPVLLALLSAFDHFVPLLFEGQVKRFHSSAPFFAIEESA